MDKDIHIADLVKGDEIVFRQFVFEHTPSVYSYVFRILKNDVWTEEVVCDVFIAVWNNRRNFGKIENIDAWLHKVAYNRAVSFLRKEARWGFARSSFPVGNKDDFELKAVFEDNPESDLCDRETIEILNRAMSELPARCRQVLYLTKIKCFSYKETADILEISVKTVGNHLTYAMKKLAENLEKKEFKIGNFTK